MKISLDEFYFNSLVGSKASEDEARRAEAARKGSKRGK